MDTRFHCQEDLNHGFRAHQLGACQTCGSRKHGSRFTCDDCFDLSANQRRFARLDAYKKFAGCEICGRRDLPFASLRLVSGRHFLNENNLPTDLAAWWRAVEGHLCACPNCVWQRSNPDKTTFCESEIPNAPRLPSGSQIA